MLRALAELENTRRRAKEDLEIGKIYYFKFCWRIGFGCRKFLLASENAPKDEIEKNQAIKNYCDAIVMTEKELKKIWLKKSG